MTQWILTSSLLIAVVLLIRKIAGDRLSARVRYALWGLVLLRLLIPVSIGESALSLQNWLPDEAAPVVQQSQPVDLDVYANSDSEEISQQTPVTEESVPAEQRLTVKDMLPVVYIVGAVLVAAIFLLSNLRFWLRLHRSGVYVTNQTLPVYETAAIESPCMYGLLRPGVYVTPAVLKDEKALRYVLAHELTHYRHGDHIWSFLRCLAVILHWYNPLVWTAAFASQLDGELACDEGALCLIGENSRNEYARTLINLTCVGYGGMLTTATSMTGRRCDLRNRVVRISKNPKMSVTVLVAVLVIAAVVAVVLFTGASTPAIEGVWRMDVSALGVGMNQDTEAYMEYEFYDGWGMRVDVIDGQIRSAERFIYAVNGDEVTLEFLETEHKETYNWFVADDSLILRRYRGELVLHAYKREKVPFLHERFLYPAELLESVNDQWAVPTAAEKAKIMQLLRSGTVVGEYKIKRDAKAPVENTCYHIYWESKEQWPVLEITHGGVYVDRGNENWIEFYELDNMAEIEELLQSLSWNVSNQLNINMETQGFVPADMIDIVQARLILLGKAYPADPARLAFLEELLTTAEDMGWVSGCPFEGVLEVTLSDGRVLGVVPALDSCAAFLIGDRCYEYGNQFENPADDASYDNSELLSIFGLDTDTIMALWEEVRQQQQQGEPMGGLNDQGDVIRVLNDVMEPTRLPDSTKETIIALLAEGMGEAIGEEAVEFDNLYYTILFENMGAAEGFVTLSDNGSLYMDGVRYELRTAADILQLLDAHYNELRITQEGYDVTELSGVTGEFLYVELRGVPRDSTVNWVSSDENICTVTGDATGAEIYVTGSGLASVSVHWSGDNTSKADGVVIYADREDYATNISEAAVTAAEDLARKDYEAWRNEDYCIRMDVLLSDVDEAESVRLRMMYDGFEDGWTKEYLAENFVAVRVTYDCELDHQKTFLEDGIVTKYTLLVRDNANAPWRIWDYSMM